MKNSILILILLASNIIVCSCKKSGSSATEDEQPDNTTPSTGDFGYAVIYTNDYIYTDPQNGASAPDNIDISIDNKSKGKISAVTSSKIYYGTKNTVSIKLPVGNFTVKATTTSGAIRTNAIKIEKNDTTRVKMDYSYNDPNSNAYYIEYYVDGKLKKYSVASTLTKWNFYVNNVQQLISVYCVSTPGYFDGPGVNYTVGTNPVNLKISRQSWKLKPSPGSYTFASGTLIPSFEDGGVSCNYLDAYAKLNITEVKVVEDMGMEKRGYYKGTFDAIVYSVPVLGATPKKHTITNGKFFAFMGGISFYY